MKVGLFVTCLVDLMRPSIGFAALRLLEAAGCAVIVPATQTCCGQPGYNSGDRASALALARKVLGEFEACEYVIAPSGSCAGMIRTHYPDLFRDQPERERVDALCARTYELTDFLVNVMRFDGIKAIQKKSIKSNTYTYHDSCSGLRELNVKAQPRALLAQVPGLTLKEMDECETCCGFGGTFAVKYGDISTHIADRKCENIAKCGAEHGTEAVVLGDLGCMLNIEGRLRRRGDMKTQVLHVAEVLAGVAPA
ncbi:MAG: (Fe-S)-binding protein [Betaproteobacteria bacterium]|nr:(Fe-S)-binding protein [Betaproteobacteria bacterium]